jgi:N-acyl homoserine lactone hydrolase
VEIQPLRLGTVEVRRRQVAGEGRGLRRRLNTLKDTEWTDPLPINAWLIRHPEGIVVVDTGESAEAAKPGYYPSWHPYYRRGLRMHVEPDDEIGHRLQALGVATEDVRWVVLTHLHTDHAGGIGRFRHAEVVLSRREYSTARGLVGKIRGYLPQRLPEWLSPRMVSFDDEPVGPFRSSLALTESGDILLVPTPGHTLGHMSVIVRDGPDRVLFLAGDASYTQELMLQGVVDGVAMNVEEAAATLGRIRRYVRDVPTVYLPSHDPGSVQRFEGGVVVP